jgi:hypothetical protein
MSSKVKTGKAYWQERIEEHFEREIAEVRAKDPSLQTRLKAKAKDRAIDALGVRDLVRQEAALLTEKDKIEKRLHRIRGELGATAKRDGFYDWQVQQWLDNAAQSHLRAIMERDKLGRQIAALEDRKRDALDALHLATSPKQVAQVWKDTRCDGDPSVIDDESFLEELRRM